MMSPVDLIPVAPQTDESDDDPLGLLSAAAAGPATTKGKGRAATPTPAEEEEENGDDDDTFEADPPSSDPPSTAPITESSRYASKPPSLQSTSVFEVMRAEVESDLDEFDEILDSDEDD